MKVYIASGWFSEEQEKARLEIKEALDEAGLPYFSPKDDNLVCEGATPKELRVTVSNNIDEIDGCDCMVASTIGKDMGTLFEAGYAYSKGIPVIYYAPGLSGNFNLMLAMTAHNVATSKEELRSLATLAFPGVPYIGRIE